ncbi:alpha/beta hydrolase [Parasphingopyxis algicola]|uniref:alpha/beta fold hydrolase n=1 Tax=Parasphingopyxis algicola TaxID=2026624 RepID=UPI0015A4463D|nr:alpha/beta hydrolase [Parasphingopyxis algicola]QLC26403.1 alpha/beta hydrolase [Parasphingopyxis algicola]
MREVAGAGGVPLVVAEGGLEGATPILFIHGIGRSFTDFKAQFEGALSQRFRLVAFDLRGHGNSGKPWEPEAYLDSALWAEDVRAVMEATGIERPVVVGWSYGGIVALDYVEIFGDGGLAGINFVGNAPVLVYGEIATPLTAAKDLCALSAIRNIEGYRKSAKGLVAHYRGEEWSQYATLIGMMMPAYVRRAILTRPLDYRDIVTKLEVPLLISYGEQERAFNQELPIAIEKAMPGSVVSIYPDVGHSPFLETPERFDDELGSFADRAIRSRPSQGDGR